MADGSGYYWHKAEKGTELAEFLKAREPLYVAASARFLGRNSIHNHVWSLYDKDRNIRALLVHSKRSLFPVFNRKKDIPLPRFIEQFLQKIAIHSIQGLCGEVECLETALIPLDAVPSEQIDYDLMAMDREPNRYNIRDGLQELVLRHPNPADMEELFLLQAAYEQEEVLPRGAVFNPASCRLSLEHIAAHERMLIAELEGRILGKINTSAASFSRYQIGGVYVHPKYRGLGVASCMTAAFVREILVMGKGVTLFVKKRNIPAGMVYRRLGFQILEDYRISYY